MLKYLCKDSQKKDAFIWRCHADPLSLSFASTTKNVNFAVMTALEKECTDFIIKIMGTDCDLQVKVNTLMEMRTRDYNKGYADCTQDRRKSRMAAARSRQIDFLKEVDVIDDVMSSPFAVEHE